MSISSATSSTSSAHQPEQNHKLALKEIITKIAIPIFIALALLITTICLLQAFPIFVSAIFIAGAVVGFCVAARNYFKHKYSGKLQEVDSMYQEHCAKNSLEARKAADKQAKTLGLPSAIEACVRQSQRVAAGLPPLTLSLRDRWLANNS